MVSVCAYMSVRGVVRSWHSILASREGRWNGAETHLVGKKKLEEEHMRVRMKYRRVQYGVGA